LRRLSFALLDEPAVAPVTRMGSIVAMREILIVGVGGFVGSVLRFLVGGWIQRLSATSVFPLGTLGVNVIGCLAIGFLAGWVENLPALRSGLRAFLFIGLLGGFTTFSTFGGETMEMLRDGQFLLGLMNVGLHVVVGLAAVWLGFSLSTIV